MGRGGDADAVPDEFSLIERLFEPLAGPEGLGLRDDAAMLTPLPGHDLVLTKDAIAEGRHYLSSDPPDTVAKKLLRVNLSDLAAKGATPRGYLLSCAWSAETPLDWMEVFAGGLKDDQSKFGLSLWGGDTIRVSGPSVFSLTAIGDVPSGQMVTRAGAVAGDDLWVTGTIGDAALGLLAARGEYQDIDQDDRDYLISRYRIPQPPIAFGGKLVGVASAALDVSDGLLGDLEHICSASQVGARVNRSAIPLSQGFAKCLASDEKYWELVYGGGDDYQILFAASSKQRSVIESHAGEAGIRVHRIGALTDDHVNGVQVAGSDGQVQQFSQWGYRHF